jgi:hypothetical protein
MSARGCQAQGVWWLALTYQTAQSAVWHAGRARQIAVNDPTSSFQVFQINILSIHTSQLHQFNNILIFNIYTRRQKQRSYSSHICACTPLRAGVRWMMNDFDCITIFRGFDIYCRLIDDR